MIEAEELGVPIPMPENALSIEDFGAKANDGLDDATALMNCIEAAGFAISAEHISFYDFSLSGNVKQRKDSIDPPAFNLVAGGIGIMGCRIRNIPLMVSALMVLE